MKKSILAAAVLALSAAGLAGCASDAPATGSSAETAARHSAHAAMTGAWAKAAGAGGMTGVFGTLENNGGEDITVVAASSPAASAVELHETAMGADGAMAMQEIEAGFTVPAGGDYVLEPGAGHLMLMGLHEDLLAGETLVITLEFADGSSLEMEATAKDFAGANESYGPEETGHGTGATEHTHGSGETHADH